MIYMKRILIVEDDSSIHECLEELLIKNDYEIDNAYSGTETLLLLEKEKYDLLILDLMIPGISGEEIIKKVNDTPIIVLSAKISSKDKVNCLLSGANDYITKPFDSKELLARIEVQLRRKNQMHEKDILQYKNLELYNDYHTLRIGKEKIKLTKTEYAILKQLFLNQSQVIPKNKLLDLISLDSEILDENSLKVHISNIRKKMKKISDKNYIESVWGIGFKLVD